MKTKQERVIMIEPRNEVEVLEIKKSKIRKGATSTSATLPRLFRALAEINGNTELEVKTVRDKLTKKLYVEIRLIKKEEKPDDNTQP
jgi:hypothetical protein